MSKRIVIAGITGGYASGKSLVAEEFRKLGAIIIDADLLAREVVLPGSQALQEISSLFGQSVILPDGSLDRKKTAEIIFNDETKRRKLEAVTHPRIRQLFLQKLNQAKSDLKNGGLILYVVPLLFESNNKYPELEKVIVVSAPAQESIKRIMQRDGSTEELASKKYYSQMPIESKEKLADYIIKNDSGVEDVIEPVKKVFSELLK